MKSKKLLTTLTTLGFLLAASSAMAAVPMSFTHHGLLWEDGELMNGQVKIVATLYDGNSEVIKAVTKNITVENGFYNFTIDGVDKNKIVAADKIELGIKVGDDDEMTPRIAVSSVPFAIQAAEAGHAQSADSAGKAGTADSLSRQVITDSGWYELGTLTVKPGNDPNPAYAGFLLLITYRDNEGKNRMGTLFVQGGEYQVPQDINNFSSDHVIARFTQLDGRKFREKYYKTRFYVKGSYEDNKKIIKVYVKIAGSSLLQVSVLQNANGTYIPDIKRLGSMQIDTDEGQPEGSKEVDYLLNVRIAPESLPASGTSGPLCINSTGILSVCP